MMLTYNNSGKVSAVVDAGGGSGGDEFLELIGTAVTGNYCGSCSIYSFVSSHVMGVRRIAWTSWIKREVDVTAFLYCFHPYFPFCFFNGLLTT